LKFLNLVNHNVDHVEDSVNNEVLV
jgi:hypothetical protein